MKIMDSVAEILNQMNQTLSSRPYDEVDKQKTWQFVFAVFPDEVIEIFSSHNDISYKHKILDELFQILDYLTADLEDINYILAFQLLTKIKKIGNNSTEISVRINTKISSIENQDNQPFLVKNQWIIGLSIIVLIILIIVIAT